MRNFLTTWFVGTAAKAPVASLYKVFVALVLVQFSVLSFLSVGTPADLDVLPMCDTLVRSSSFWWGLLSMFGALALAFESLLRGCWQTRAAGYLSAMLSFGMLGFEFLLRRPPMYAGIIFSATSVVFLGGLLYGLVRKKS